VAKGQLMSGQYGSNSSIGDKNTTSQQTTITEPPRKTGPGASPNLIKRTSRGSSRKPLEIIENKPVLACQKAQSTSNIMAAYSMKSISTQIYQATVPLDTHDTLSRQPDDSQRVIMPVVDKEDKSMMTELTSSQLDLIMNDFSKFKSVFKVC
jgi:hypothetical protein